MSEGIEAVEGLDGVAIFADGQYIADLPSELWERYKREYDDPEAALGEAIHKKWERDR